MTDQPIQSASERDGCETPTPVQREHPQSSNRLGRLSTPAAVGSAILSSACCWLPLLLLAFGLSAGGVAGFFETVRPYFLAAAATRVFHIEGMTCAACAATLEVQLAKLPGVSEARVSYGDSIATVRSTPELPSRETVDAAIEAAGFKMTQSELRTPREP